MDYERCAALHNTLLEMSWVGSGKRLESDAADHRTPVLRRESWFERHGAEAEKIRSRLSSTLVLFLERALDVDPNELSLSYYVGGLSHPRYLWLNNRNNDDEPGRYITLYEANSMVTHPDGLVFDQKENKAIMQMSIFDSLITRNGRQQWHPLEVVLSSWLDMVRVSKVEAVSPDTEFPNEKFDPWVFRPFSQAQLDEALAAYHTLISAIESRLPGACPSKSMSRSTESLVPDASLDAADISHGFARSFLSKARRPAFRYIAPGLQIPDPYRFCSQPFRLVDPDPPPCEDEELMVQFPILLFPSSETFHAPSESDDLDHPFPWPWSQLPSYQAGFYFTESDRETACFEDGVRLVLPFGIGSKGWARTADGARFGENKEDRTPDRAGARDVHDQIYQLGYVPFVESHEVRLVQVLRAWLRHVESGSWDVGEDGVLGGMGKWREADTEERWEDYVVPTSW